LDRLDEYLVFAERHAEMFANPPGGFTILLDKEEIRGVEKQVAEWLKARGMPANWAEVGIAFQDQYGLILRDAVEFPNADRRTYTRFTSEMETGPGVVTLPRYREQLLLIRHFRHATRAWHLEVPRGFGIAGLSSEESALAELDEEIGATVSRLVSLGRVHPDSGAGSDAAALFYAEVESYGDVEAAEGIAELLPTSVADFEAMIRDNEITDGFTIAAYARAKLKGLL
jgi:ADP-ribose pyrophosphatase